MSDGTASSAPDGSLGRGYTDIWQYAIAFTSIDQSAASVDGFLTLGTADAAAREMDEAAGRSAQACTWLSRAWLRAQQGHTAGDAREETAGALDEREQARLVRAPEEPGPERREVPYAHPAVDIPGAQQGPSSGARTPSRGSRGPPQRPARSAAPCARAGCTAARAGPSARRANDNEASLGSSVLPSSPALAPCIRDTRKVVWRYCWELAPI